MITVKVSVKTSLSKAWEYWTNPAHIVNWNFASADWHCPAAKNNLTAGGSFTYTMAARDGSAEFDFKGVYKVVEPMKKIEYLIEDGRSVIILFEGSLQGPVTITESFDPENIHSEELQQQGWQSILDQYKKYLESSEG